MHLKNDVILTTLTETGGYDDLKNKIKPKLTPVQMYKFHSNRDFVIKKTSPQSRWQSLEFFQWSCARNFF